MSGCIKIIISLARHECGKVRVFVMVIDLQIPLSHASGATKIDKIYLATAKIPFFLRSTFPDQNIIVVLILYCTSQNKKSFYRFFFLNHHIKLRFYR